MKNIKLVLTCCVLLAVFSVVHSQNCYVDAQYTMQGNIIALNAQLYSIETGNNDTIIVPVSADYTWIIENSVMQGQSLSYTFQNYGTYVVTVTAAGANSCSATSSLLIEIQANTGDSTQLFSVYILGDYYTSSDCAAGLNVIAMGGTPPFSYVWNTGATGSSVSGLCAGVYCVTATDDEGHEAEACFQVELGNGNNPGDTIYHNNLYVSLNYYFVSPDNCSAVVSADVWGGTPPYSYAWNNGQNTITIQNVCEGQTLCLTVVDAEGNAASSCVYVTSANTIPSDSIINEADPWETTVTWPVDSMFNTAQVVDYWVTNTEVCVVWALVYQNSNYTETITVCYPIDAANIADGWYSVFLHVLFLNGQKAYISFGDVMYINASSFLGSMFFSNSIQINTYPNPVADVVNLVSDKLLGDVTLIVYDASGRVVDKVQFSQVSGAVSVNTSGWNDGMYCLHLSFSGQKSIIRLIKQSQ